MDPPQLTQEHIKEAMPAARQAIVCILKTLCTSRQNLQSLENTHAVWVALTEPGILLYDYAARLQTYMHCSHACLVISIIYIDRLIQLNASIAIHPLTIHRLLLAAMVVSAKYWDDEFYKNSYYAKVGGLPVVELNKLEADFCFEINFEFAIDPEMFAHYFQELAKHPFMSKCPNCNPDYAPDRAIDSAVSSAPSSSQPQTLHTVSETDQYNDEVMDIGTDETTSWARQQRQRMHQQDPTRAIISPASSPKQAMPSLRQSFGASVSTRISFEENRAQDLQAYRRHSSKHSFARTHQNNPFNNAPAALLEAAADLMGWDVDEEPEGAEDK